MRGRKLAQTLHEFWLTQFLSVREETREELSHHGGIYNNMHYFLACRTNVMCTLRWLKRVICYAKLTNTYSIPAGTKNSLSEDLLLAKHKDTNIPTMMGPFFSPAAWFDGQAYPTPGSLRKRGWTRLSSKGLIKIKSKREINLFLLPLCKLQQSLSRRRQW